MLRIPELLELCSRQSEKGRSGKGQPWRTSQGLGWDDVILYNAGAWSARWLQTKRLRPPSWRCEHIASRTTSKNHGPFNGTAVCFGLYSLSTVWRHDGQEINFQTTVQRRLSALPHRPCLFCGAASKREVSPKPQVLTKVYSICVEMEGERRNEWREGGRRKGREGEMEREHQSVEFQLLCCHVVPY